MNPEQRAAVRSNAKYLRGVRPLDPDEIAEYVPDGPHPAAIRQVLREAAPELGIVEHGDGTFAPVPPGPVDGAATPVEAFPEAHADRFTDLLVDAFGREWDRGATAADLRERIRRVKAAYLAGDAVTYDRETALAYGCYHLPAYYATVRYVIADLARDGLLDHRLRVLDVGAGLGGPALGIVDALPDDALVVYDAVEPSDAMADGFDRLLADAGPNVHHRVHRHTATAFADEHGFDADGVTRVADDDAANGDDGSGGGTDPTAPDAGAPPAPGTYDLVLFANVLNELDDPTAVATRYADAVAPHGTLVGIAPADRETSIGLRTVERHLVDTGPTADALTVHAPTVRLWPGERPTDTCWAFDVKPDIATPSFQERLDDGSGTVVNRDVQFSHVAIRRDGRRRIDLTPGRDRWHRMADSADHVSKRVDLLGCKLSHSLAASDDGAAAGDGPNPVYKLSDGSESASHFAVLVDETSLNRELVAADYGALLAVEGGLLLWNDDEDAFNLVVDAETVVDRMA